jgi:RNA polymerase sigma-70 factor (ECF subfamily)
MTSREREKLYGDAAKLERDLRAGEGEAFTYLFERYYDALFHYASRLLHDAEPADDAVQETFCRFYELRGRVDLSGSIKAYLYKSVYHHCLNVFRHREVHEKFINREMMDFYFTTIMQSPDAELALDRETISLAVREAIDGLPARCREVFLLKKEEGLSNGQVSEKLGISVKTVEAQVTIAFRKLQKELEWLLVLLFILHANQ